MTFMPVFDRPPTVRERSYLAALAEGQRRPSISGQAGHMCRKFGWCEVIYLTPEGIELTRSALPGSMDPIAVVKAGYRAVGFALTARGKVMLAKAEQVGE